MRIGRSLLLLLAIVFAATTAHAQNDRAERRGEQLLARHCAMCHAIGRQGVSPHRQAPPFRTLAKRYPIEALEEALGEGLYTGHPDMPEFVFAPADVGAILAYLKSIQEP
jgi:cytochrome c